MAQVIVKQRTVLVVAIAGYSGSGKTVLIEKLLPLFCAKGLGVATIKHSHHNIELDSAGKDSFRHRQAGAKEVILACNGRWMLVHELRHAEREMSPLELLPKLSSSIDVVLVEGFKLSGLAKIEVWRGNLNRQPIYLTDATVRAVATLAEISLPAANRIVKLNLMNPAEIVDWILAHQDLFKLPIGVNI